MKIITVSSIYGREVVFVAHNIVDIIDASEKAMLYIDTVSTSGEEPYAIQFDSKERAISEKHRIIKELSC